MTLMREAVLCACCFACYWADLPRLFTNSRVPIAAIVYQLNPLICIEALDYTERYRVTLDPPQV